MRWDLGYPREGDDGRMLEMDGAILRSLDRFVGQLVQSTWRELSHSFGEKDDPLPYSGIHLLGAGALAPFLKRPGVFLTFGPLPEVRILHLGATQVPMQSALTASIPPGPEVSWQWRSEAPGTPVPTYGACVSMEDQWTMVKAFESLLGHYLAPLQSTFQDPEEDERFT